jgi:hypothetical protein
LLTKGVLEGKVKILQAVVNVVPGDNIGMMFFGKAFAEKEGPRHPVAHGLRRGHSLRAEPREPRRGHSHRRQAHESGDSGPRSDLRQEDHVAASRSEWTSRRGEDAGGQGQYFLQTKQVDKLPDAKSIFDPTLLNREH